MASVYKHNKPILSWYLRLRLFSFIGQSLVLALAVGYFKLTLPWLTILLALACLPLTNLLAEAAPIRHLGETWKAGMLIVLDTLLLAFVLSQSGGPTNPFSIIFLLNVVLAAVTLTASWTWLIATLSSICFSALFLFSRPVPEWGHHGMNHGFSLHLHGMLFSYVLVAFLAAFFLSRMIDSLRLKERELERLENIERNQSRLMALTALLADAAHRLGTPLSTISVISQDLQKLEPQQMAAKGHQEDLHLLYSESQKCKQILTELAERTGDVPGEMPVWFGLAELRSELLSNLNASWHTRLVLRSDVDAFYLQKRAVMIALQAIVKNAFEASDSDAEVQLSIFENGEKLFFEVVDKGAGIPEETLLRIGEPFFSGKPIGQGMGLGIYVAKLIAEQLGGAVDIRSAPENGTRVLFSVSYNAHELKIKAA